MHKQQIPAVAQDVIESGRITATNVIAAGRAGTRRALSACDQVWRTGANTLACNPGPISQKLRDDLISLQGQLTLIAGVIANGAADRTDRAINDVAAAASSTVGECERVLDPRLIQAMTGVGAPIAETIQVFAGLVATVSLQLAELVAVEHKSTPAPMTRSKSASPASRNPARRAKQKRTRA